MYKYCISYSMLNPYILTPAVFHDHHPLNNNQEELQIYIVYFERGGLLIPGKDESMDTIWILGEE